MAGFLIGLVGWPLMVSTVSTEGTDSWEAVSRAYSYVFGRPWQFIWYSVLALVYGAIVVFFVGFMGSFTIYLAKWGVSQTPFIQRADRDPSFLFVYAPTSFGWRELLLEGVTVDGQPLVQNGRINDELYNRYLNGPSPDKLSWWNKAGAGLVGLWVGLLFLVVLGFGYSFFFSGFTIMYLLLRREVDGAEMDEVYLEEEEFGTPFGSPLLPSAGAAGKVPPGRSAAPGTGAQPLLVIEPPRIAPTPPAASPVVAPSSAPTTPSSGPLPIPASAPTATPTASPGAAPVGAPASTALPTTTPLGGQSAAPASAAPAVAPSSPTPASSPAPAATPTGNTSAAEKPEKSEPGGSTTTEPDRGRGGLGQPRNKDEEPGKIIDHTIDRSEFPPDND
jgi:hypothetical protein